MRCIVERALLCTWQNDSRRAAAAYLHVPLTASCLSVQAIRRGLSPQPSAFRVVEQAAAAVSAPAMDPLAILAHLASQVPPKPCAMYIYIYVYVVSVCSQRPQGIHRLVCSRVRGRLYMHSVQPRELGNDSLLTMP